MKSLFGNLHPWKEPSESAPVMGELHESLDEQADEFIRNPQKLADLDGLRTAMGRQLLQLQQRVRKESFDAFSELTADAELNADWTAADRREILVRYLGFPFWDQQIYPLLAFADIGEFDQVKIYRLSPDDATLLGGGPATPEADRREEGALRRLPVAGGAREGLSVGAPRWGRAHAEDARALGCRRQAALHGDHRRGAEGGSGAGVDPRGPAQTGRGASVTRR